MGVFKAEPTKDFFIDMLTRDIPLERAILDLIDNSVDGARDIIVTKKKKSLKDENAYKGFKILLSLSAKEFVIEDNCGGFSKEAATKYTFKFGRPRGETGFPKGSIGRFGVGMKRGIFKIGNYFIVETRKGKDHFIVEENIDDWSKPDRDWEFNYIDVIKTTKYKEGKHKPELEVDGTLIKVREVRDAVKQDLTNTHFQKKLMEEISRTLSYCLLGGLEVKMNGTRLFAKPIQLLVASDLRPYYLEERIEDVDIKIYAGIGPPDPNEAGWYIYCNDRLMVENDKTNMTGWEGTEKFFGDSGVQKFHNKVAMFRGLVFFNSDNSASLPMTTTKTGIDINSTIYKTTRRRMIDAMKTVLSHINKLENDEQRQAIVKHSKPVDIVKHNHNKFKTEFVFPDVKKKKKEDNMERVAYKVSKDLFNAVKKDLKAKSKEDVGLGTFNYYVEMKEIEE